MERDKSCPGESGFGEQPHLSFQGIHQETKLRGFLIADSPVGRLAGSKWGNMGCFLLGSPLKPAPFGPILRKNFALQGGDWVPNLVVGAAQKRAAFLSPCTSPAVTVPLGIE